MSEQKKYIILSLLALTVITVVSFLTVLDNGFVNWDDRLYVTDNPLITEFSWANIKEILSTFYKDDYRLLTVLLTYMAEYRVAGLDPFVYHLDNLLLHVANALLVFVLVKRLSGRVLVALVTALFFAVHPTRVEAVAWVSERKGVLSAFFFLQALIFYIVHRDRAEAAEEGERGAKGVWAFYGLSVFVFLLALLSKLVAVSLPVVLLLVDYLRKRPIDRRLILDKLPYVFLSAAFALDTIYMYETMEQLGSVEPMSTLEIVLTAGRNLYSYLALTVWPAGLSAIYPYPRDVSIANPEFFIPLAVLVAAAGAVAWSALRTRKVVFGSLFFLFTILPVLQLVPFASGGSVISDRYLYIPSVGLFFILATGLALIVDRSGERASLARGAVAVFLCATVGASSYLAFKRGDVWSDPVTLWEDVLARYPESSYAHYNIANAYNNLGRREKAVSHYRESVRLDPDFYDSRFNLGNTLTGLGRYDGAVEVYKGLLELYPERHEAHYNLGLAYSKMNRPELAAESFRAAARRAPSSVDARYNLGNALARLGRLDGAIEAYSSALAIDPRRADVLNNLGIAYAQKGELSRAVDAFRSALAVDPEFRDARENIERALGASGDQ